MLWIVFFIFKEKYMSVLYVNKKNLGKSVLSMCSKDERSNFFSSSVS